MPLCHPLWLPVLEPLQVQGVDAKKYNEIFLKLVWPFLCQGVYAEHGPSALHSQGWWAQAHR